MTLDHYCVMGNPISHSRSPWIHTRFAELTGQAMVYDKREIALDQFARSVHAFMAEGGRGCNITVPFKFEAAALASHTSERAQLAQACNVLSFQNGQMLADNTDGMGLVMDIERNAGWPLKGLRLLLIGAGGAAAGVLGPLINAQPAHISVANRTVGKASALVARHLPLAMLQETELLALDLQGLEADFDVIINATASSLGGVGVPVDASVLKPGALAYDMMYGPAAQGFMDWARAHGAVPRDGLGMLVEQAAEAFLIWRGVRPPSDQVLAELRQRLRACS
ncbi:MAG: shikimate dehydrogenase [Rhodoferax sp.]|nr:shikimate dehydrogenase [Betaproteobacteria bacterium]NCN97503.1 shikimate dehydrogenase [Rhodoferax sp.]OIP16277.1 MAG: shikimate dehydrogenase [Comamonadaceae bacterium CG2_30_57_122]PJC15819.1 MAG: shikimate dehydrogenase [Comamonadaceae bacterium CG_4_9_14_0_8_um_filter_57_21]NCP82589.1 shikimate dehydrogenase [Rhodoferax sp.]